MTRKAEEREADVKSREEQLEQQRKKNEEEHEEWMRTIRDYREKFLRLTEELKSELSDRLRELRTGMAGSWQLQELAEWCLDEVESLEQEAKKDLPGADADLKPAQNPESS